MSKRAEEAAIKAYPYLSLTKDDRIIYHRNTKNREAFIKGYEQAEKDIALNIEDIEKIHTFLYAIKNNKQGAFTFTRLSDEQYEEVLRRFKAIKEEQK